MTLHVNDPRSEHEIRRDELQLLIRQKLLLGNSRIEGSAEIAPTLSTVALLEIASQLHQLNLNLERHVGDSLPAVRTDVHEFSVLMSEVMDCKHREREGRGDPQYMSADYSLGDAIHGLEEKTEILFQSASASDVDHAVRTALHVANYAMIIARKLKAQGGAA
jgi:hypothetical protein